MLFYPIGGRTHSVGVTGKLGIPVHSLGSTLRPCDCFYFETDATFGTAELKGVR